MKNFFFLTLIFLCSCASRPDLTGMSHEDLTDYVMKESLLTTALSSSTATAASSMQPFESNMDKGVYGRLTSILREHFKYEEMYTSIKKRIMTGAPKKEVLGAGLKLNGSVWQKYLKGMEASASVGQERYMKLYKALDDGTFDLTSERAKLVARITDRAYTVNLVNLTNTQVLRLLKTSMPATLTDQQKNVLNWIANELKTLNDTHIKTMFASAYLSTESFSEAELKELLEVRSNEVLTLGKSALEEELNLRYFAFFKNMQQIGQGKKAL